MGSLPDGGDGVVGICLAQIHQTVHILHIKHGASQEAPVVKNIPANAGGARDASSISRLERSPGEGNGTPPQYAYLENSMDRGAWRAAINPWGCKESDMAEVT